MLLVGAASAPGFLLGSAPTLADVRLTMTLLRYDSSYRAAFGLRGGKGGVLTENGYPAVAAYLREMADVPRFAAAAHRQPA